MSMFQKAQRKKAKLKLAMMGPSGSGKTYSSLLVAQGLGSSIAMIDTENGSGELYSDLCEYDVAQITPPFKPQKYIDAIKEAENAGYEVLIIDSLSHAWAGEGGMLDIHDKATQAQKSKNSYTAWREVTPLHNQLIDSILQSNCHVIMTARTKTAYDLQDDGKGNKKPVKVGLAPVFRDGIDYEATVVLDLSIDGHIATVSKDRTSLLDGQYFVPSQETGRILRDWLEGGAEPLKVDLDALGEQVEACESMDDLKNLYSEWKEQIDHAVNRSDANTLFNNRKEALNSAQEPTGTE